MKVNREKTELFLAHYVNGYIAALTSHRFRRKSFKATMPIDNNYKSVWLGGFKFYMIEAGIKPIPKGCKNRLTRRQIRRYRRSL